MIYLTFRGLWARRATYGLVLVEMLVGYLCLALSSGMVSALGWVHARAGLIGPPDLRIVTTNRCSVSDLEQIAARLRQHPAVARLGLFYYAGTLQEPVNADILAMDAQTAAAWTQKLAAGRWFESRDFADDARLYPAVVGHHLFTDRAIGDVILGRYVIIGRLAADPDILLPNGDVLRSIPDQGKVILTVDTLVHSIATTLPGYMSISRLLIEAHPHQYSDLDVAVSQRLIGTCDLSITSMAQVLADYDKARRPQVIVTTFIAGAVLLVGTLGFMGLALVIVERRSREFAIRLAVGATTAHLAVQVFAETLTLTLLTIIAGLPLAYLLGNVVGISLTMFDVAIVICCAILLGSITAAAPMLTLRGRSLAFFIGADR